MANRTAPLTAVGRLLSDPLAIDGKAWTARFAMIRRLIKVLPMSSVCFVTFVTGSTAYCLQITLEKLQSPWPTQPPPRITAPVAFPAHAARQIQPDLW